MEITEIKQQIDDYLADGGDLYVPAKSLPFYEKINSFRRQFNRHTGGRISLQEIFTKCGYIYDKDYNEFVILRKRTSEFVNDNDFVDLIKKNRKGTNSIMTHFRFIATKYQCNYADFLYILMGYKLKQVPIKTNYIETLRTELEKAYPSHNLNGIKRDNPKLYEKIRHTKKYCGNLKTTKEVIEFLGFYSENFKDFSLVDFKINDTLSKLLAYYPDRIVSNLSKKDSTLYYKLANFSASQGKTIKQVLSENGFEYKSSSLVNRLAYSYADSNIYYSDLQKKLDAYYDGIDTKNLNDYELYKLHLEAFLAISAKTKKAGV